MTNDERVYTAQAMKTYGGSFVQALGQCLYCCDSFNQARIEAAFPDYIKQYGPGSAFYQRVYEQERG